MAAAISLRSDLTRNVFAFWTARAATQRRRLALIDKPGARRFVARAFEMLRSLVSLADFEIEAVIAAVTAYCDERGERIDSAQRRKAITAAVDLVSTHRTINLLAELRRMLPREDGVAGLRRL